MSSGNPIFKSRAVIRLERDLKQPFEDYLAEQYRTRTIDQIADQIGFSPEFVRKWMGELGVETRFTGQRPPEAAA